MQKSFARRIGIQSPATRFATSQGYRDVVLFSAQSGLPPTPMADIFFRSIPSGICVTYIPARGAGWMGWGRNGASHHLRGYRPAPLLTRDIFGLVQLVPGVIPQDGNPTSLDSERNQVSNFTINGAPQGTVYYLLDAGRTGLNARGSDIGLHLELLDGIERGFHSWNYDTLIVLSDGQRTATEGLSYSLEGTVEGLTV